MSIKMGGDNKNVDRGQNHKVCIDLVLKKICEDFELDLPTPDNPASLEKSSSPLELLLQEEKTRKRKASLQLAKQQRLESQSQPETVRAEEQDEPLDLSLPRYKKARVNLTERRVVLTKAGNYYQINADVKNFELKQCFYELDAAKVANIISSYLGPNPAVRKHFALSVMGCSEKDLDNLLTNPPTDDEMRFRNIRRLPYVRMRCFIGHLKNAQLTKEICLRIKNDHPDGIFDPLFGQKSVRKGGVEDPRTVADNDLEEPSLIVDESV